MEVRKQNNIFGKKGRDTRSSVLGYLLKVLRNRLVFTKTLLIV